MTDLKVHNLHFLEIGELTHENEYNCLKMGELTHEKEDKSVILIRIVLAMF